jgi:carbonic anhydrase
VQKSWRDGSGIKIHGWVYDLRTGYLKEIALMDAGSVLDSIYKYDYELE